MVVLSGQVPGASEKLGSLGRAPDLTSPAAQRAGALTLIGDGPDFF